MKLPLILSMLLFCSFCKGQKIKYKEYDACIGYEVYKGKKNHGKSYCISWATVRKYTNGITDTIEWSYNGKSYIGNEYEKYKKLSDRGKYVIDSLKEDGITRFQDNYLMYEPIYMKRGKKVEFLWDIQEEKIVMYKYLFWNNSNGNGVQLLKMFEIN